MKTPMIFFFLITLAFSANAQEATIEQLNQKIEQLENRVSILESIIANSNKKKSKQANVTAIALITLLPLAGFLLLGLFGRKYFKNSSGII